MKKYFRFLVVFLVLSCWIPHIASAQVVNVPDPNLAEALRGALGLAPNAPITRQDVQRLGGFLAVDTQIRNLTGLEHATQLERLDLRSNQISDLTPLARLTGLEVLILANNQISNISALTGLTRLRLLALDGNRVSNLVPLARPTQLDRLFLIDNQVSNLAPLAGLTQLTELYLDHNQIRNISPLARLSELKWLALKGNQISNLNPLARMTQLERLALEDNQIRDVTPLGALTNLTHLFLKDNQIRDVSALARLVNLRQLILAGNPIQDTSPLASLTNLDVVDVKIAAPTPPPRPREPKPDPTPPSRGTDLVPDAGLASAVREALRLGPSATFTKQAMQRLNTLNANVRQIKNLTGLEHATQLKKLFLHGNQIRDLSPLADLSQLKELLLGSNQIQDVTPLAGLTQLEWLALKNNQIRDLSPLARLVNLRALFLVGNPITDTTPLANLTKLVEVDIEISIPTPVVRVESPNHPPMYWVNTNNGILYGLVNAEVENPLPNVRNATGLAIDVANEKVYWTEKTSNTTGKIRRANLDGTNVQLVKNLTSAPHSIALDAAAGKIYLTNAWGKVQRLNIDGSNFEPNLITELDTPGGLALNVLGDKVYWTEKTGRIRRANLDGSNVEDIATGLGTPLNIATSGGTIYWTEKTGENSGAIRFVNLRGTPNIRRLHSFSQGFPVGIAVDVVENTLYWTTSRGNIGRSNLDGSNFQPNFVTGLIALGVLVLKVEMPVDVETPEMLTTDTVVSISPSPIISPGIGDQLTINLNITAGEAVAGYQGTVQFDPTALRYVESNNVDYLPAGAFFVPPIVNGNRVKLASTVLTGVSDGDGTLATLTFEVVAAKASRLSLSDVLLSDSEGNTVSPQVEGGQVTEPAKLAGDVNSDGVVNIQDLVLVASNFGQVGANAADVNGDGVVNITDLVKVAGALGNAAAAPSLSPQVLAMFTTADVQKWLFQAQHLDLTDVTTQRGVHFLEQLLATLIPKETLLLPNYPNPFNPETWIPYQLAKPADVTLTIYGVDGKVVRRLSLGHQLAGVYQSRRRAAYWDGRNALGEPVASGIYFYQLQADNISLLRKMLILK